MFRRQQRGFGIATALFLLVVLGALTAYLVSLSTTQQKSSTFDLTGAQAFQAARAGVEWGAYELLRNGGGAFATGCDAAGYGAPIRQNLPALPGSLSAFTVSVDCGSAAFTEKSDTFRVYQLRATACSAPAVTGCPGIVGTTYVERQLLATLSR
jgi:MSHA biogenesis protein MshP